MEILYQTGAALPINATLTLGGQPYAAVITAVYKGKAGKRMTVSEK